MVESQPSKLLVAGSIPVSRSMMRAHVAQLVERVLGKDEVTSSSLVVGSSFHSDTGRRGSRSITAILDSSVNRLA